MRAAVYFMFVIVMVWLVTVVRFNCSTADRDACAAICAKNGKVFKAIEPGLVKTCHCVTDWLKKQRQEEELRKRLRENRPR